MFLTHELVNIMLNKQCVTSCVLFQVSWSGAQSKLDFSNSNRGFIAQHTLSNNSTGYWYTVD